MPEPPDPDRLKSAPRTRGRLKVFLGTSPGVGKTYEMLRAARRRKAEGDDVVVGVVETHGRRETESRCAGIQADTLASGSDEERLALPLLDQGAVALERAQLAGEAVETESLGRADRFRAP